MIDDSEVGEFQKTGPIKSAGPLKAKAAGDEISPENFPQP
jgi:hypothetical protein